MVEFITNTVHLVTENPLKFSGFIISIMLIFVVLELSSLKKDAIKDFKSVIISIGILGTFVGIFAGLWSFNTTNISDSIPELLSGLKFAFITSIAGMFFSTVLSIVETTKGKVSSDDQESILKNILSEQKEMNKNTNYIYTHLDRQSEKLDLHFESIKDSLKTALEVFSKGATDEITKALRDVIADFNNNLNEQFGDNFKQLNMAVSKMIDWQENYKIVIENTENNLKLILNGMRDLTAHYQQISKTSQGLSSIIETNQNQIKNLETHLASLKRIGEDANAYVNSISGLNKLNNKLHEDLNKSLGILDSALSSLTDKFREDYESFLNKLNDFNKKVESIIE